MRNKILIIDDSGYGVSAAVRLRRLDENAEIIIFKKNQDMSITTSELAYYISNVINFNEEISNDTIDDIKSVYRLDMRIDTELLSIDTENKKITFQDKDNVTFFENYDYLLLSPNIKPLKPSITEIENERIFKLISKRDADAIKDFIKNNNVKDITILGSHFIGIELAGYLATNGLNVRIAASDEHLLTHLDKEMSAFAEKELLKHNVVLKLNIDINSIEEKNSKIIINLKDNSSLHTDMVILNTGVIADTDFLKDTTIKTDQNGYIEVDSKMKTNIDNVYAINASSENIALKQARIAADNIGGIRSIYKGDQNTFIIKIFDSTSAATGINEADIKKQKIPYNVVFASSENYDSYYPDSTQINLKLIFDKSGTVLGAQAFGYSGVDKRIDVIAAVIRAGGSITDLTDIQLCYSPPYSCSKDIINIAGYIAENVLSNVTDVILPDEICNYDKNKTILLDIRTDTEYENGYINGAQNIPLDTLRYRLAELDISKEIWIYCQHGVRGYIAQRILTQKGFKTRFLTGGYEIYNMYNFNHNNSLTNIEEINSEVTTIKNDDEIKYNSNLNACGICCPGPLLKVKQSIDLLEDQGILKVTASDQGFYTDIQAWCKRTGNGLLRLYSENGIITAYIKKNSNNNSTTDKASNTDKKDNKTIIVFSGDLDKAIASFIIANGALSMGKKVTMFFTFWGLNILRKPQKLKVKKTFIENMFGIMMPRGSKKLKLSKMNMLGAGGKMIRMIMKKKNIFALEELIQNAIDNGIDLVACQMSMEVMGIKKEELLDNVKIGGVGYYLGEAEDSNVNLFI